LVSYRLEILRTVSRIIGEWVPSSTIFLLGEIVLLVICMFFVVELSTASLNIKNLAQEVVLLLATP
jgi:hypothetical protein